MGIGSDGLSRSGVGLGSGVLGGSGLEGDGDVTDPFFSNVVFLSGFNGADGATSAVDDSNSAHTITFQADAQLDTAERRFGTASLLLDGTGDFVEIADSEDFNFAAGDFTIEAFIRPAVIGTSVGLVGPWDFLINQRGWTFSNQASDQFQLDWSVNGIAAKNRTTTDAAPLVVNTWYYIAVVRDGDNVRFYLDGTELSTTGDSIAGDTLHNSTAAMLIGAVGGVALFNGHIDEMRITKGIARSISSVPSQPFPRS